jgi:hypothetical protein
MGWTRGSEIANDVWEAVGKYVPDEHKRDVARELVDIFESHDCDTMDEAEALMKDAKLNREDD